MKLAIISGSHRNNSESDRVAKYTEGVALKLGATAYFLSLANNPLPLWDEGVWNNDPKWEKLWGPISAELQSCDGIVVVSPEWSGMVPAGLKNFFLLCGSGELSHKPGLIISVSSGMGGTYPIAELRTSSYKNTRLCYIPDHVIVRNVGSMLKGDSPTDEHDAGLRERISYSLRVLMGYSVALKQVRQSGVIDRKQFPFGM